MNTPFDDYPEQGRQRLGSQATLFAELGPLAGRDSGKARRGYGLALHRKTGQVTCGYCGASFVEDFANWLTLSVDHVVPQSAAAVAGFRPEHYLDGFNLVLACRACNDFGNRMKLDLDDPTLPHPQSPPSAWTDEEFAAFRDAIFARRKTVVADLRAKDREFFERTWKTQDIPPNTT